MPIRHYLPGDEEVQARIFNLAAGPLPKFKAANVDEIRRRYQTSDPDPTSKFYAVEGSDVVGYAVLNPNGRISYPWCLPEATSQREPLLESVLAELKRRSIREAWVAYRADWLPVLQFFKEHGFAEKRQMINYVAELDRLPQTPIPDGWHVEPLTADALPGLVALGAGILPDDEPEPLRRFFWDNPFFGPDSLLALKDPKGRMVAAALLIGNGGFADPTKLDSNMPCFRLGVLGTERERHKRVNGMFSCVFETETAGEVLLAEAARRLRQAGLAHMAAQAASDTPGLCDFYDRNFERQGAFPILSRTLA